MQPKSPLIERNAIHSRPDFDEPCSMTTQSSEATIPNDQKPTAATSDSAEVKESGEETTGDEPSFGWNDYAERLNGRFAMIGFAALLITQLFTRQDFWSWIGL